MKCDCEYCYFQSVGVAKETVDFADQTEAKKSALEFIYNAFREAHPKRREDGLSENTVSIMLGEWGLGKTQLLKCMRTAINNSAGLSQDLRDEYEIPFKKDSPLSKVTLQSIVDDVIREEPSFESRAQEQLKLINESRGVAFRIDALKFHDEIHGEDNLLIPLFNIVLKRCQIEQRITTEEELRSATKLITDHFGVDRVFIFFDELEILRTIETDITRFDSFFKNFSARIKAVIDNSSPPDVSICLATIPSIWEALTRQFEELGALKSRASKAFINLSHLTIEKAHRFIMSRCRSTENCPFRDGTVRTLLEAAGRNPRHLNQLLFGLQPELRDLTSVQHDKVLEHLEEAASDRTAFNYDHQALLELEDAASDSIEDSTMAIELLGVLTGSLREWSAPDLYRYLGKTSTPKIEEQLNKLCTTSLRGLYTCVKLILLDRTKALMQGKLLHEQKQYLSAQGYLGESDIRIEKQTLLVHDLEYERQIIAPLESRFMGKSEVWCFLPVDDECGVAEMQSLWNLNKGPVLEMYRTLRSIAHARATIPYFRLSMAARDKIFPGQSPKEPPFEWVDESFWRDAFAYLYDPATPRNEKRKQLLNGLKLAGQAYGAKCIAVDETAFSWVIERPSTKNARYFDPKPLRCLVQISNDIGQLKTQEFKNRMLSSKPDFVICISTTHLTERPNTVSSQNGRPQIEVIYRELETREEFKLQLLGKLNEEAKDLNWYISEKMKASEETLGEDLYGEIIDKWLSQAEKTGYLTIGWDILHGIREDSLSRVIRELISITPSLPATYEEMSGLLRKIGVKDLLDQGLLDVCINNRQFVRDDHDRISLQLLPTQKSIIEISERFPRAPGVLARDYQSRIASYFWQGPRTELSRELERHILVVEELGYFDGHTDLDLVLKKIDENLDKVREKDKYGATIDQYSYEARKGQIGAKRAERLARERDYFREEYRRNESEFHKIDKDLNVLIPRVIRHQLIDIEKRVQEIIATGEGPYLEGQKAVRRGLGLLDSTYYELVGEGAEIKIKDHVNELQDYSNHKLLKEILSSHQDGIIADDEERDVRSAPSLAKELENELKGLEKEHNDVEKLIADYNQRQRELLTRANELGKQPGLKEQIQVQINQLERADRKHVFRIFKSELENVGLEAGKKKISEGLRELNEISDSLKKKATHAKELSRLNTVINLFKEKTKTLSEFLVPRYISVWSEKNQFKSIVKNAKQISQEIEAALKKAGKLQREFSATETQSELLTEIENLNTNLDGKLQELIQGEQKVLQAFGKEVNLVELRFDTSLNELRGKGEWSERMASLTDKLFRREIQKNVSKVIDSLDVIKFEQKQLQPLLALLKQGFSGIEVAIEFENWLNVKHIQLEDYKGTDLEAEAGKLHNEKSKIAKLSTDILGEKNWEALYKNLLKLACPEDLGDKSSSLIDEFNNKDDQIKESASQKIDAHVKGVWNYIEALFSSHLLDVSKRAELLDELDNLSQANKPYVETIKALKHISQRVNDDAKIHLKGKKLPGDHNPDTVLAIVQEIYRQQGLTLRNALRLDKETDGKTVLWLIRQGVLDGKVQLAGD